MRLLIDLQTCQSGSAAGSRYHLAQALALVRQAGGHEVWLALNARMGASVEALRGAFGTLVPQERIVLFELPAPAGAAAPWRARADEQIREAALAALAPDVIFVPNIFDPADSAPLASIGTLSERSATVVSLGDAAWLTGPAAAPGAPYYRHHGALRNAALVLVPAPQCAGVSAVLGLPPEQVRHLGLAVSDGLAGPACPAGVPAAWLIAHASGARFESGALLIAAFALQTEAIRRAHRLLIVGALDASAVRRLKALGAGCDLEKDQLAFAAPSCAQQERELYGAAALVLCAGPDQAFAALEALTCGVPAIAARDSALAPLIGAPEALFEQADAIAVAAAMARVLSDAPLRQALRTHGCNLGAHPTMLEQAAGLWAAFEAVAPLRLPAAAPAARAARPRLAYVSPLPPEPSGIADYSAELAPELARYYDIDLIVDQERVSDPWIQSNLPLRSLAWFETHAHEYERVLYHFGNSPMHKHMFALLERHPGIVVLHDFYLGNILEHLDRTGYLPGAFRDALYHSHGFSAFADQQEIGLTASIWKYPCNKAVLDRASGIIVHARYPQQLAMQWYGPDSVRKWRTLPLLRGKGAGGTREAARQALGLAPSDFVLCSFGMLGPTKRNDALLNAWLASPLARDPACRLVFVGANDPGAYGNDLRRKLEAAAGQVTITGFVSHEHYCNYLQASDAAVQLRIQSRGETSAAILDCLLHGVPTIANAHGSSAELPDDVLCKLADDFAQSELIDALVLLRYDARARATLSARARQYIQSEHAPARVGRLYYEAIEYFSGAGANTALARAIGRDAPADADLSELAGAIGANSHGDGARQLLVDISALVQSDLKTGIQRVVRSVLKALLADPPAGYRIEPVYSIGGGAPYCYARSYMARALGIARLRQDDAPIDAMPGDMFLGLDLFTHGTRLNQPRLQQFRKRGVQVYFVVYDILPILRPAAFPPGVEGDFQAWLAVLAGVADGLVCISRAVADEVAHYLEALPALDRRPLQIGYFHLGADIGASVPSTGQPDTALHILEQARARPTFLMVGTLEPRKGHAQALAAFELLWAKDVAVNLVIVGKPGWMVEPLITRLRQHPANGHRLFWLDGASDEILVNLYEGAHCLLAASEGEGFGLPLIEAAQHGIAIIARRLPVFEEVAGQHAYYFEGSTEQELADALQAWLRLHSEGKAPGSTGMPRLSWAECTGQLRACIVGQRWHRSLYQGAPAPQAAALAAPVVLPAALPAPAAVPSAAPAAAAECRQLLVDVSAIARHDLRTGIERVVRAQLSELLRNPPDGWRVEPVYLSADGGAWHYCHARKYASELVPGASAAQQETAVEVASGDLLYCPDFCPDATIEAAAQGLYAQWRARGVHISFLIHDLLPISQPEFFPEHAGQLHARWLGTLASNADRLICISHAVADQVLLWLKQAAIAQPLKIAVLHHGADLNASAPTAGLPADAAKTLRLLAEAPTFLMVGTIEPRKGHLQALAAFEQLWRDGNEARLVIVGKEGWTALPDNQRRSIPRIAHRLGHHPQLGKRLFWLPGISDEYLQRLYEAADCLLVPSEGEGFGLPLLEAARCGLPILARDLPVFHEVARQAAYYFSGLGGAELAAAITDWLALHASGEAPSSRTMQSATWAQNARELMLILSGGKGEYAWPAGR